MLTRTAARACALPLAATAIALSVAGPASAHVTATPSVANAGAYTVLTFSNGHGCDGSPTTAVEIQIPESVLSVTPTRNPLYNVKKSMAQLEEPVTDAHGNEVTERVASIVYTAKTPLPDGQRDTFELSFQIPDAEGETLTFPTIQSCEQGENAWVEVPAEGQDADELESPAPSFEILPASESGDGHGHSDAAAEESEEEAGVESTDADADTTEATASEDSGSGALGWAGLGAGLLGLAAGGTALARTRTKA